jgi:cyclopropane-fatty-acyl-phospholipid synthase
MSNPMHTGTAGPARVETAVTKTDVTNALGPRAAAAYNTSETKTADPRATGGATPAAGRATEYQGAELAADLLTRLFRGMPGSVALRLWDGRSLRADADADAAAESPPFTLVFRNPQVICALILSGDKLALAEAYFRGGLDIEGDFFAALALKDHLKDLHVSRGERLRAAWAAVRLRMMNAALPNSETQVVPTHGLKVKQHSKAENRDAIRFHYDVSNDFYALWLDRAMVYSCAYFENPGVDLDAAQQAKLEHICRKLSLQPGERLLDIGCGWGALVMHAARHHGVHAHGVTLSAEQLRLARERIAAAGLSDRVSVELMDYRDLPGAGLYDKIASVGMFEHVGLKNLPAYYATVHRLLKPRGLFLNHGITSQSEGWKTSIFTEFINRYVFPDGQLDTISNIQRGMEHASFEIADVEALRPHYAMTLRHWVARLERNHVRALQFVDEAAYRVWRLYMAACAQQFESGSVGIYQVLAAKRAEGSAALPLTRRHLYV